MDEASWLVDLYGFKQKQAVERFFYGCQHIPRGWSFSNSPSFVSSFVIIVFLLILRVLFRVHPGLASDAVNHVFANASSAENV